MKKRLLLYVFMLFAFLSGRAQVGHAFYVEPEGSVNLLNNIIIHNGDSNLNVVTPPYNLTTEELRVFMDAETNFILYYFSPAVDAGVNSACNWLFDLADSLRIRDAAIDLGAYEFVNTLNIRQYAVNQVQNGHLYLCNNVIVNNPLHVAMTNAGDVSNNNILSDSVMVFRDQLYDFSLYAASPAVNAGRNSCSRVPYDLQKKSRICEETVDIGAFEHEVVVIEMDSVFVVYQNEEGSLSLCNNIDINNNVYAGNTNVQGATAYNIFDDDDSLFVHNVLNFMPRDSSRAIDAGLNSCNTLAKDLAKKDRVMGESIEIGAYEQSVSNSDTLEWQYVVHQQTTGQLYLCNNIIVNNPAHVDVTNVEDVSAHNILSDSVSVFCDIYFNFKPFEGSPAVDSGLNSCNAVSTDIDMSPRIAREVIDIGAFELPERNDTIVDSGDDPTGGGTDPSSPYYHTTVFHSDEDTLFLCNNIIINNSVFIGNARPDADSVSNILVDQDTLFTDNKENFMPREHSIAVNRGENGCNSLAFDLAKHQRIYEDIIDIGAYEQFTEETGLEFDQLVLHQLGEGHLILCNNIIVNNPAHTELSNIEEVPENNILSDSLQLFLDPFYDFSLWLTSPAVNAGLNSCCTWSVDIARKSRVYDGTIDVGAFEYAPVMLSFDTIYTVMQDDTSELSLCNNILINNGDHSVNTNIENLPLNNIWQDNDSIFTDNRFNFLPLPQSIAVNAGSNDCNTLLVDLAKSTRVMADTIEIGAYEVFEEDTEELVIAAVHQVDTMHRLRLYNNIIINNPWHTHNYAGSLVDSHNMLEDTPDVFVDITSDFSLMVHSPAIDTGANEWVSWRYDLKYDERISCANIVDLGAFEYSYDDVAVALTATEVMTDNCMGSYILLQATPGAQHYIWSHTNEDTCELAVSPLVSTSYTVVATNGGACRDTATIQISPSSSPSDSIGTPSSIGKTFWLSYLRNHFREPELTVQLSAERACSGVVSNPRTSWSVPFTVGAHSVTTVTIPLEQAYPMNANAVGDFGILVEATDTISVYAANYNNNSFDVTVVLPVNALDDEYMVQTYVPTMNSEFVIVATEDNTEVEITPSKALMGGHAARQTYVVTMQRGQTYLGISRFGGAMGDLSGSIIKARDGKRVAVFNGNVCAMVPTTNSYTDHLVEQAVGVKYWGRSFALTTTESQNFDMVRVTALRSNTVISKNGTAIATIQTGETYEFQLMGSEGSCFLETSQPAGVYLYIAGAVQGNDQELSDPSMIWIPPVEQKMNDLTFATFQSPGISAHYVNVVIPADALEEVTMDGQLIGDEFSLMPANPQFAFVKKHIQPGTHTLQCEQGFIAHVYGLGYHESYGYAAGSKAEALKEQLLVNDVPSANLPANQRFCPYEPIDFRVEVNFACDSVLWNFGDSSNIVNAMSTTHAFSEAGNYAVSATLFLTSGEAVFCTSMYVGIRVIEGYGAIYYDTVCYGGRYQLHGFDVETDETGHFTHTRTVEMPGMYCDSTYVLELEVLNNVLHIEDTICEQNTYVNHGFNIQATMVGMLTDTLRFGQASSGCDSMMILHLLVTPNMENIPEIIGETYPCVGEVFTYSLDSLSSLQDVTWMVPDSVEIIAQPDDYHISLLFETSDYQYEISVQGHNKCGDTILWKTIYPQPYAYVQLVDTICDNERHYQRYGFDIAYVPDTSDVYVHHDVSSMGCDSTTVLAIVIMPTYQWYDTLEVCENDLPYLYHDTLIPAMGTHEVHLSTACDCDSLVYLTLLALPETTYYVDTTVLFNSLPFVYNGIAYDSASVYSQTLSHANVYGCDSVIYINLNVLNNVFVEVDSVVCENDLPFDWNGVSFMFDSENYPLEPITLVDTAIQTLPNGVDSIIVMTVQVHRISYGIDERIACDSLAWLDGMTYYTSTNAPVYTIEGGAANGCDSIVMLHLTVNYSTDSTLYVGVYENTLPYVLNDSTYSEAGTYSQTLVNAAGCDSILTVNLTIFPIVYPDNIDSADCVFFPEGTEWGIGQPIVSELATTMCASVPLVGDIDDDGQVEIVMHTNSKILIFNSNAELKNQFNICSSRMEGQLGMAKVKYTSDEYKTIIVAFSTYNHYFYAYDASGTQLWQSNQPFVSHNSENYQMPAISFADFNHDGWAEMYAGSEIYDAATGVFLGKTNGNKGRAGRTWENYSTYQSSAADVAGDFALELAVGNTLYSVDIQSRTDASLNHISPLHQLETSDMTMADGSNIPFTDGNTYLADFNLDGQLDVLVMNVDESNRVVYLYVWDVASQSIMCSKKIANARKFGMPQIGDLDSDGYPEICFIVGTYYNHQQGDNETIYALKYNEQSLTGEMEVFWTTSHSDFSGATSLTLFDFNQDGYSELVYRDENQLRIINGSLVNHQTGAVVPAPYDLATYPCGSGTALEYPVVCDVDMDGEADIVVGSGCMNNTHYGHLYIFKSAGVPWAPARKVWNQYMYNVTNVNEDLTVPQYMFNIAMTFTDPEGVVRRPYNNFLQQATTIDQYGRPFYAVSDVVLETFVSSQRQDDTLVLTISYCNNGDNPLNAPYPIAVFANNYNDNMVCTFAVNESLPVDSCVQKEIKLPIELLCGAQNVGSLIIVVNSMGFGIAQNGGLQAECDTTNNKTTVEVSFHTDTTYIAATTCDSYTWIDGVTYTESTTTPAFVMTNSLGCDSVLILNLTINSSIFIEDTLTICENDLPYIYGDTTFEIGTPALSNYELHHFTTSLCDSVTLLTLQVLSSSYNTLDTIVLENELPLWLNGLSYSTDSTFTQILAGADANGCDSVLTVNLTVLRNEMIALSDTVCESQLPIIWNGVQFDTAGTQDTVLTASTGVDSTVVMTLMVNPTTYGTLDTIVLENGLPLWLNGFSYSSDSTFTQILFGANANGCDSVLTVNLTVLHNNLSYVDTTVCDGDFPLTWNGVVFTTAGTKSVVHQGSNGADSTVVMTVNYNPTTYGSVDTVVLQNDLPWEYYGSSYSIPGIYTQTITNAAGCDSVVTINLTEIYNVVAIVDSVVCAFNTPFVWNGITFTQTTTRVAHLTASTGADSTLVMRVTVIYTTYGTLDTTVLENDLPFVWNGESYNTEGYFNQYLQNYAGCDSILTIRLHILYNVTVLVDSTLCENDLPLVWNGISFELPEDTSPLTSPITLTDTVVLQASNGVDSTVVMHVLVNPSTYATVNIMVSEYEFPFTYNNADYAAAGVYTQTLPAMNQYGCDSLLTLRLHIRTFKDSVLCQTEMPLTWNGVDFVLPETTFTSPLILVDSATLPTSAGVDSTVIMTVIVNPVTYGVFDTTVVENALPLILNGEELAGENSYTQTLNGANVYGCDSVLTVNLSVLYNVTTHVDSVLCQTELPLTWNGVAFNYTSDEHWTGPLTLVDSITILASTGVDSTIVMTVTVNPVTYGVLDLTVVENAMPLTINDEEYDEAGNYTQTLYGQNVYACDSILTINITVLDNVTVSVDSILCQTELPLEWNEVTFDYTSAAPLTAPLTLVDYATIRASTGVDSTVMMTVTVNPTTYGTLDTVVVENALPLVINGEQYGEPNNYSQLLNGANRYGCDSVLTINLTVLYNVTTHADSTLCMSELPLLWNGVTFAYTSDEPLVNPLTMVDSATVLASTGVDSTIVMTVTINPSATAMVDITVSEDDFPFEYNGVEFAATGVYEQTFPAMNQYGCDSLLTIRLHTKVYRDSVLCQTDMPLTWNGVDFVLPETTSFTSPLIIVDSATLPTSAGVDSTVIMTVIVNPVTYGVFDTTVVENALPLILNGEELAGENSYTQTLNGANVYGCDSILTVNLSVLYNVTVHEDSVICQTGLPLTWNGVTFDYPFEEVQEGPLTLVDSITILASTGVDSAIVMTVTVNPVTYGVLDLTVVENAMPITLNGELITTAGTFQQTLSGTNSNGCDSVLTIHLTVLENVTVYVDTVQCYSNLPFVWNGLAFAIAEPVSSPQTLIDSATILASTGVDSTVVMTVIVNPSPVSYDTLVLVENQLPYYFAVADTTIALGAPSVSNFSYQLPSWLDCDSTIMQTVFIHYNTHATMDTMVCASSLPYTWHGHQYTQVGSYNDTILNADGSDHVITYQLNVSNPAVTVQSITHVNCYGDSTGGVGILVSGGIQPYNCHWEDNSGTTVSSMAQLVNQPAGKYHLYALDAMGCMVVDSVTLLHLTDSMVAGVIASDRLVCHGSGVGAFTGTTASGGASSVYQWQISTNGTTWTASPAPNNAQNYSYSNTATTSFSLRRAWVSQACGTVYSNVVTVSVAPVYNDTLHENVCQGYPYQEYGFDITAEETAEPMVITRVHNLQSVNSCDSTVTLVLTVIPSTYTTVTDESCQQAPYQANGFDLAAEELGTVGVHTFERVYTTNGCDSIVTLQLTIHPVYDIDFEDVVCEGSAYNLHGFDVTAVQTLGVSDVTMTQQLQSQDGCDSIVNLYLRVVDTSVAIVSLTADFCEEYTAELSVETNMTDYLWNTGETSQTITVNRPGTYMVTATQDNCSVTSWYTIENCELNIYLPNAITPSISDGLNDYFCLHEKYLPLIEDFEIRIYTRWGELVYYSDDKNFKWYGVRNPHTGEILINNIYTYLINFTDNRGIPHQLTGSITVL